MEKPTVLLFGFILGMATMVYYFMVHLGPIDKVFNDG